MDVIYIKTDGIVEKKVGDEVVLVPLSKDVANMAEVFTLNEVGAFIFGNMDGKNSIHTIVSKVVEEFDVERDTVVEDVEGFVKLALEKEIIRILK